MTQKTEEAILLREIKEILMAIAIGMRNIKLALSDIKRGLGSGLQDN